MRRPFCVRCQDHVSRDSILFNVKFRYVSAQKASVFETKSRNVSSRKMIGGAIRRKESEV